MPELSIIPAADAKAVAPLEQQLRAAAHGQEALALHDVLLVHRRSDGTTTSNRESQSAGTGSGSLLDMLLQVLLQSAPRPRQAGDSGNITSVMAQLGLADDFLAEFRSMSEHHAALLAILCDDGSDQRLRALLPESLQAARLHTPLRLDDPQQLQELLTEAYGA